MDTTARLEDIPDLTPITEVTGPHPRATIADLRRRWGPVAPVELEPGLPAWLVLGYEEYCTVVRDDEIYSRRAGNWRAFAEGRVAPTSKAYAMVVPHENVFFQDGERRRTLRAPIDDGLGRLDERSYARRLRRLCHQLVEKMLAEGSADLMTDYAVVVPLLAVAELFGMSEEQGRQMTAAARRAFAAGPDAYDAVTELMATVVAHIERRRARPQPDLTTAFLEHPNLVDDNEVVEAMSLMIIGGYELTIALIVQTLMLMLTDRSFGTKLARGHLDVDQAIDQVLWRDPPGYNVAPRFAVVDTVLGNVTIRRGDAVVPSIAGANEDPLLTSEADPWSEVGNRAHLSWSTGLHVCPAQRPARIIVRTAVQTALDELPGITLAVPEEDVVRLTGSPWSRYPISLPVSFMTNDLSGA